MLRAIKETLLLLVAVAVVLATAGSVLALTGAMYGVLVWGGYTAFRWLMQ